MGQVTDLINNYTTFMKLINDNGFYKPIIFKGFVPEEEHNLNILIEDMYDIDNEPEALIYRIIYLEEGLAALLNCKVIATISDDMNDYHLKKLNAENSVNLEDETNLEKNLEQVFGLKWEFTSVIKDSGPSKSKDVFIPPLLLGEFTAAFDIVYQALRELNSNEREILYYVLKQPDYSPKQVVHIANELITESIANSIDVLYCALHPEKWDNTTFIKHKKYLLNNTVKFIGEHEGKHLNYINYLKAVAKRRVNSFFEDEPILTHEQQKFLIDIVERISEKERSPKKSFIDNYLKLYNKEHKKFLEVSFNKHVFAEHESKSAQQEIQYNIHPDSWKLLSRFSKEWQQIYGLIKYPSDKYPKPRKENYMFDVVKAILYHEGNDCFWSKLPQDLISGGEAAYYYYRWRQETILGHIFSIVSHIETKPQTTNNSFFSKPPRDQLIGQDLINKEKKPKPRF